MAKTHTVRTFTEPATIDTLLEALGSLRDQHGGQAVVRARGKTFDFSPDGPRVQQIAVESDIDI